MKWLNRLSVVLASLLTVGAAKNFLDKYEVLIFDKDDLGEDEEPTALDLRGTPTHSCVCGSNVWYVKSVFEDYEISQYFLDMICAQCGALATAPTLIDKGSME